MVEDRGKCGAFGWEVSDLLMDRECRRETAGFRNPDPWYAGRLPPLWRAMKDRRGYVGAGNRKTSAMQNGKGVWPEMLKAGQYKLPGTVHERPLDERADSESLKWGQSRLLLVGGLVFENQLINKEKRLFSNERCPFCGIRYYFRSGIYETLCYDLYLLHPSALFSALLGGYEKTVGPVCPG